MTINHAPVSQSDFMATIAESAGLEKGQFGRSVFDVDENEIRERCTHVRWIDPAYPTIPGKHSNAIREFCYIGDNNTIHQMISDGNYINSYQLYEPFY